MVFNEHIPVAEKRIGDCVMRSKSNLQLTYVYLRRRELLEREIATLRDHLR